MRSFKIALAGAGSLRAAPRCLAVLADINPERDLEIRLFDANEERLDLMDRLMRQALEHTGRGHLVASDSDPNEVLTEADAVILCVGEDCARRLLNPPPIAEDEAEDEPGEKVSLLEMGYGDPNRPTKRSDLSRHTQSIIHRPVVEGSRDELIELALETVMKPISSDAAVLNLQRGASQPQGRDVETLNWPPALDEMERQLLPHRILRWIGGEPSFFELIEEGRQSPVKQWLDEITRRS